MAGRILISLPTKRKWSSYSTVLQDIMRAYDPVTYCRILNRINSSFLGLMADAPGSFSVPTLDIDLAWHTHQLRANYYHTECKRVVGRYVDQQVLVSQLRRDGVRAPFPPAMTKSTKIVS